MFDRPTPPAYADNRIVNELTRRGFLGAAGLGGGAALLGLAGCSSSPRTAAATTRQVATAFGSVDVPANPKRVVCVDTYSVNALFDIGFTPVGVGGGAEDFVLPKDRKTYTGLTKVSSAAGEIDIEAVAALHPDLIVGLNQPPIAAVRTKLAGIAPTAVFSWDNPAEWKTLVASVTTAVGRSGDETALEQRYRTRAAKLRTDHADMLPRVQWDLITGSQDQAYVWLASSDIGVVLADGGVRFASASGGKSLGSNPGGSVPVSFERLGALDAADAIAVRAGTDGQPDATTKTLLQQPTFKALPAAKAGRVFPLKAFFPFSYGQGIALLDELDPILTRLGA